MKTFIRYLLFQIPGFVMVVTVLLVFYHKEWIGLKAALSLLGIWIVKDMVFFPLLRHSYSVENHTGIEQLFGEIGFAIQKLSPEGYIRLRGELWKARSITGEVIEQESKVKITGGEGLLLFVEKTN